MKYSCGNCKSVFEVMGIKENVVTCSKCRCKNSIKESVEKTQFHEFTGSTRVTKSEVLNLIDEEDRDDFDIRTPDDSNIEYYIGERQEMTYRCYNELRKYPGGNTLRVCDTKIVSSPTENKYVEVLLVMEQLVINPRVFEADRSIWHLDKSHRVYTIFALYAEDDITTCEIYKYDLKNNSCKLMYSVPMSVSTFYKLISWRGQIYYKAVYDTWCDKIDVNLTHIKDRIAELTKI